MQSLRILHVTPYFSDAWAYGGIPRLAHALTRGLARRGHHVTVCTTDVCDRTNRLPRHPRARTADGVEVRVFPNLSNRLAYHLQFFLPVGLNRYLRRHAGSFDVAHLHACRNLPGVVAAFHLDRAGVPYVLAPNGTAPIIERRRGAKRLFDALAGRRVLEGAARVLAVSQAESRQLADLGVEHPSVRLIPNPVALDEFAPAIERGRFRREFGIPAGPIVMYLGKLTPRKRLDVLVRAFAAMDGRAAILVVAGNDMGSGRSTRALVASLGLAHRTVFTGLLQGRTRLEALADADVVVYPSQDEIFGLVPLESLLSGTPVIVADDSGCGEVIRGTGGGIVVGLGDAAALAAAIATVLENRPLWRASAADAGAAVRSRYGDDVVCSQLDDLYRELVPGA
jgi:glycosyltransferase involved in cell wall biosynthesis